MKKNNKGFTLIEVIAVVVIIGIMAIVAVPKIYSLVSGSRNEIYIQDAKRFISKTQYEMSSGNENIEKPYLDECIVVSLNYLGNNDFNSAPNDGEYLPDASFVIVKNVDGKYYYSVMLVEEKKDDTYIGVELSSEMELAKRNAKIHVRSLNKDEVVYINEKRAANFNGDVIDLAEYINDNIKTTNAEKELWTTDNDDIVGYYYGDKVSGVIDNSN